MRILYTLNLFYIHPSLESTKKLCNFFIFNPFYDEKICKFRISLYTIIKNIIIKHPLIKQFCDFLIEKAYICTTP